jgi:sister chromatid cohesion protein PDS5
MARRRAPPKKPVEVEEVEAEPESEPEQQQSDSDAAPAADEAGSEDDGDTGEQAVLQFDQELSWRPAKPIATGTLIARLETLAKELADFDQGAVDLDSLKRVTSQLAHRNLLQHKDRGVKAYTACCLVDLLRLYVPEAPFTDDQLTV